MSTVLPAALPIQGVPPSSPAAWPSVHVASAYRSMQPATQVPGSQQPSTALPLAFPATQPARPSSVGVPNIAGNTAQPLTPSGLKGVDLEPGSPPKEWVETYEHLHQKPPHWGLHAMASGLSYTLGRTLAHVPFNKVYKTSALLSPDPRQFIRAGLGVLAVNQLNKALGWEPPSWAVGLETVAVVHTLMLGFSRKQLPHLALTIPLVLGSVLANRWGHEQIDHVLDRQKDWDPRFKTALSVGSKLATMGLTLGVALKVYPSLFMQLAKHEGGWLKPLINLGSKPGGEVAKAANELKNQAYRYLIEQKGTREAKAFLATKVKSGLPESLRGVHSVEHAFSHHKGTVEAVKTDLSTLKAIVEQTLEGNEALLKQVARVRPKYLNPEELVASSKQLHLDSHFGPETKQKLQNLLKQWQPERLGEGTVADDYQAFERLTMSLKAEKDWLKTLPQPVQYLLSLAHGSAEHQLGHAPREIPFVTLLASEGLAMTCTNGCCVGSVFCWADLADLISSTLHGLFHTSQPQPTTPNLTPAGAA